MFYTSSDWVRLAERLAADASPCADYYVSIPPLAEAALNLGWNVYVRDGHTWFEAGVEMRRRMALCGYLADELWAVNEVHSGVRRNNAASRKNFLDFLRDLYFGRWDRSRCAGSSS